MKNYTVKNIIFGLRGEYLEFYKKVQELEKYVICKTPHHLYVSRNNDRAPFDVICSFELEEQAYKSDRKSTVAGYIYDTMDEESDKKTFETRVHENDIIKIPNKELFEQKVLALNEEPFAQIPMTDVLEVNGEFDVHKNFFLWPNLMGFRNDNKFRDTVYGTFYYPYEDKIFFETTILFKKPTEKMIREVLDEKIPEYLLKVGHKEIIDRYPEKELIIENSRKNNKTTGYEIVETEKELILKR